MMKLKQLSSGILIFTSLFLSACSTTTEHQQQTVPVEERSVDSGSYQDVPAQRSEVPREDTVVDSYAASNERYESGQVRRQESVSEQSASPVALAFLNDAEKYTNAGDSDRAVASLERGLDIEPKNPWLWNRLAAERLKQKMWTIAITLAKKSNAYAAGHEPLQESNWQIIAEAKMALGDIEGARQAKEMVGRFSRARS